MKRGEQAQYAERNDAIRRRIAAGEKQVDVAAEYGVTRQMISLIARENGESIVRRLLKDRNALICARIASGASVEEVASEYGLSRASISAIARGVKRPHRSRPPRHAERNAEIRRRVAAGEKQTDLAAEYGICSVHVVRIAKEDGKSIYRSRIDARDREIREKRESGVSLRSLADEYGLSVDHIGFITSSPERREARRERSRQRSREKASGAIRDENHPEAFRRDSWFTRIGGESE